MNLQMGMSVSGPAVRSQTHAPVSVVITSFDHAHFLADAIESVLAQTHPGVEVVVVDDGSRDNTQEVAARYAGVRCVRQSNQGLAAARNTGIRESHGAYLVFLDADDRLLPHAVEEGLACFRAHPECAFVSGGFRRIGPDGSALGDPVIPCVMRDHYAEMLKRSYISMHATVMFRREALERVNGFDASLRRCEDFDVYLRIARQHSVCCHAGVVGEYRMHAANASGDRALMLRAALRVLRAQWPYVQADAHHKKAYAVGMRFWKTYYGLELLEQVRRSFRQGDPTRALRLSTALLRLAPAFTITKLSGSIVRRAGRMAARAARRFLPDRLACRLPGLRAERPEPLPLGAVGLGDLDRLAPISRVFGFDRGLPIDRYYIEGFLFRHANDIAGRVLEVADNGYTTTFGGARVVTSDILHVNDENPRATVVADLTDAASVPTGVFDCVILTQTLHLIYDVKAALRTLHRILKPGGVLLVTSPGISQIGQGVPGSGWYWAFTHDSMRRLLEEVFPPANVHVEDHGNVFAAVTFLHGLALEEMPTHALDHRDPAYPVIVAARAVKPPGSS
jgi:glycosyltransferase involved in cell wall biosynthesis/SAM-dependent methyltransferase